MTDGGAATPRVIEGRVHRALNNNLGLAFRDGPGEPFASAQQDTARLSRKLGVLFGFNNGGTGTQVLTIGERTIGVVSRDAAPTDITNGVGGDVLARVERGDSSQLVDPIGRPLLEFVERSPEEQTVKQYAIDVRGPDGAAVARLDVLRVWIDWTVNKVINAAILYEATWDRAGQGLKYPLAGVRLELAGATDDRTVDLLLAACADIIIGLRPYTKSMR